MNTSFALSLMGRFAKRRCTGSFRGTSYHGRKTIFSFSGRPEKMVFPKNSRWNMIFFVLSVKMIFLFFRKYDLTSWTENERWTFSKKHMKIYFLQVFGKDDLFQKTTPEHGLSCIVWKDGVCFCGNTIFFLWTENERWFFSRNTRRHGIFCVRAGVKNVVLCPSAKSKIKDDLLSQKSS